jgi:phospholipase C
MYGLRVPTIIISPYARRAYVDHTQYDFTSLTRFAEDVFALPALTKLDRASNSFTSAFDFSQRPSAPLTLHEHACPQIAKRPRIRVYGMGAAVLGALALLLLLLITGYVVATRPALARRIVSTFPRLEIILGAILVIAGLGFTWYVLQTWSLPS